MLPFLNLLTYLCLIMVIMWKLIWKDGSKRIFRAEYSQALWGLKFLNRSFKTLKTVSQDSETHHIIHLDVS